MCKGREMIMNYGARYAILLFPLGPDDDVVVFIVG
jgi:hypothetical protein